MPPKKFQTSQRFGDIEDYWEEQDKEREIANKKIQKKQKCDTLPLFNLKGEQKERGS